MVTCPPCPGDDTSRPICGPDVTDSLAKKMQELAGIEQKPYGGWFGPGPLKGGVFYDNHKPGGPLDYKQHFHNPNLKREELQRRIDDEDETVFFFSQRWRSTKADGCPKDCPPKKEDPAEEQTYGCITICETCLEASSTGNLLFGYNTYYHGGQLGYSGASDVGWGLAREASSRAKRRGENGKQELLDEAMDQCMMKIGRCVARHKLSDTGDLYRPVKMRYSTPNADRTVYGVNPEPARDLLCACVKRIKESEACTLPVKQCDCDPCGDVKLELPGFEDMGGGRLRRRG